MRDVQGNRLAPFSTFADVTNNTASPELVSAKCERATLTLAFDEPLDEGSAPAPGDFDVIRRRRPARRRRRGRRHRRLRA